MTLMVEAWRDIPDAVNEVSPLPESQSSLKGIASYVFSLVTEKANHIV